MIVVGLAGAVVCVAVFYGLRGGANAQAPAPAGLESAAKPAEHPSSKPSEKLEVEPLAKAETAPAPAAKPEAAAPAAEPRQGVPTPRAAGFLPFPNAGESDFKLKYEGMDLAALAQAKAALQQQLNEEQTRIAEDRFARGLFEERVLDPRNPSAQVKEVKPPEGLGEVRASQKTDMQADGTIKNKTTFLSQSEHPEFFGHVAELNFLSNAWKQAGGH